MGPRLGRRGNPPLASAGPTPSRRFNGATPWEAWKRDGGQQWAETQGRFNGATPWEAWKLTFVDECRCGAQRLQWGHALGGVETWRHWRRSGQHNGLQWGHALGGVETLPPPQAAKGRRSASMGPRLGRRGNRGLSVEEARAEAPLQWGHALGGVETQGLRFRINVYAQLQWGHALGGVETPRPLLRGCPPRYSFNGATPWEAWKHDDKTE